MPKHVAIALLFAAVVATPSIAAETPSPSAEANLAWLRASGSSERETLKLRLAGSVSRGQWKHEARVEALRETDGTSPAPLNERHLWLEKSSWNFTERDYLFGKLQGERDVQSAFRRQTVAALGYGRKLIQSEAIDLAADLGAGVRRNKDRATRASDNETITNGGLDFVWRVREGMRVAAELAVESGDTSTTTRTRSALSLALNAKLHLEIAHETKHDNGPVKQRDAITTVGLSYRH